MKRVKSARIKQKQKRNMIILITLIISFCGIFIFNQLTRSEILKTTSVKFIENGIGTEVISELDIHIDETGEENKYYVILPDKINGYVVNKLFVSEETVVEVVEETQNVVENITLDNTSVNNTNTTVDDNSANQNTVNQTNTIADNIDKNSNTVAEDKNEDSLFDKVVNQKDEDIEDQDSFANTSLDNKNTVTNTTVDNNVNQNTIVIDDDYTNTVSNTTVVNKVVENVNKAVSNVVIDNTVTNTVDSTNENTVVDETDNAVNEEIKLKEVYPGNVVYLTEDEVIADKLTYIVEFNTKEINDVRLYERELLAETAESNIAVKGFVPKDYLLNVKNEDVKEIQVLMDDVDELENITVIAAYDIKITKDDLEYQPIEFNQFVNVAITSKEKLENNKIIDKEIEMFHIDETDEEIVFEKIKVSNKTIDTVECETNEFSRYAITEIDAVSATQITVNNYDNDYNYYMGLNYTEDMKGRETSDFYTKSNLARVIINYYGHNRHISGSPKGTISVAEQQALVTYTHAVPIINNKISIELIDNPFMNRPGGYGFNGWLPEDTTNNVISMDNNTYVQTLTSSQARTINSNGVEEVTINLYVDWKAAKVIYFNSNANNNNTAGTLQSPVNNWQKINNLLRNNPYTATGASSRELNIIVVIGGVLTDISTDNTVPYTITSIYNNNDYRASGRMSITDNKTLTKDVQLSHLTISGSNNYTISTNGWGGVSYDTGGTTTYDYRITCNAYNLRIGRGMMPQNPTNDNTATFAQIIGGGAESRPAYRIVIESGKYHNLQVGTPANGSFDVNATYIVGNDIDRVISTSTNPTEYNQLYVYAKFSSHTGEGRYSAVNTNKPLFDMYIKSGTIGVDGYNDEVATNDDNQAYCGVYLGGHNQAREDEDTRILTIEGGTIANVIGGLGTPSNNPPYTYIYVKGRNNA